MQSEFKDLETWALYNKLCHEQCTIRGMEVQIMTFFCGIGIPLIFRKKHYRIPIREEYKFAIVAFSSMILSVYAGARVKLNCEKNLKQQFAD